MYEPFGGRHVATGATTTTHTASVVAAGFFQGLSVSPPRGATAFRLKLLDGALQGCALEPFRVSGMSGSLITHGVVGLGGVGMTTPWFAGAAEVLLDVQGCAVTGTVRVELQSQTTPTQVVTPAVVSSSGGVVTYRLEGSTIIDFDVGLQGCDELQARDGAGGVLWKAVAGGHGGFLSVIEAVTSVLPGGDVSLSLVAGSCGSLSGTSTFSLRGARRLEGASKVAPVPMLLPGQKLSATGLVDNWYRWFERDTGRYLSTELLLQNPDYVSAVARRGMSTPGYAYAANSPLRYVDANGLSIYPDLADPDLMAAVGRLRRTKCGKRLWDYLDGVQGVDFWIYGDDLPMNPDGTVTAGDTERIGNDVRIRLDFFNLMIGAGDPMTTLGHELGHGLLFSLPYPVRYWDPKAKGRVKASHEAFARELAKCIKEEKCGE